MNKGCPEYKSFSTCDYVLSIPCSVVQFAKSFYTFLKLLAYSPIAAGFRYGYTLSHPVTLRVKKKT
jgi:hypothetical protein